MNSLRAEQGDSTVFTAQLNNEDGTPYTRFTGTETVTAVVWSGNEAAPISGAATAAFLSAVAGTVNLTLVGAATSTLVPGLYWVKIEVDGAKAWVAELEIEAAPGSTAARTAYVTVRHLRKHYRDIDKVLGSKGFADDPHGARSPAPTPGMSWCRSRTGTTAARAASRPTSRSSRGSASPAPTASPGIPATAAAPPSCSLARRRPARPDDGSPRLHVAHALARILSGMVSNAEDKGGYLAMARRFEARATILAQTMTLEIDSDGDGVNDTTIRLGSADTMES
jgi:hypothetical protein